MFNWSQVDSNCPAVQDRITFDCGDCFVYDAASTLGTVIGIYLFQLSALERECTFSVVGSEICGFTGPSSDPVTVILKGIFRTSKRRHY